MIGNFYKKANAVTFSEQLSFTVSFKKVPSRGTAETTLECNDDGPKGEVFIT